MAFTARFMSAALLAGCLAAAPLAPTSTVDDVLDAMHDRGGDLKSFTAGVTQAQVDTNMGTSVTYRGTVVFQSLPGGDARLHLVLDTKQKGQKKPVNYKKEYVLAGGMLVNRDYPLQLEDRRQVVRPGEKLDLFQLGKGPFPLPIGQDKATVLRQFSVARMPPAKDDPPHTIHLQLKPKPDSAFAPQFSQVDFWVDTDRRMPVRIRTADAHDVNEQTNDLTDMKVNPPVGDADFALPTVTGWKLSETRYEQ